MSGRESSGDHGQGHERLGELCRRLMASPDRLSPGGRAQHLIEYITAEVRGGRPPEELEDSFDELEELLLAAGHSAGLGSYRTALNPAYRPLPGAGHGHPLLYVLGCPRGHCARVEAPTPDADEPLGCRIFDEPLSEITLRP